VLLQIAYNISVHTFGNSQNVLGRKTRSGFLLTELGGRGFALGADFGSLVACVNITANLTYPFFHSLLLIIKF
jgi:hypothetical protein